MEAGDQRIPKYVLNWCEKNGYTEPFFEAGWRVFPPNAAMSIPCCISPYFEGGLPTFPSTADVSTPSFRRLLPETELSPEIRAQMLAIVGETVAALERIKTIGAVFESGFAPFRESMAAFGQVNLNIVFSEERRCQQQESLKYSLETLKLIAPHWLVEQYTHSSDSDPGDSAIALLQSLYQMHRPISIVRLKEFCSRHQLSEIDAFLMLSDRRIIVKHGTLCPGKGFSFKRETRKTHARKSNAG